MSEFLDRIATLSPKRLALLALELQEQVDRLKRAERQPIAIIGMGCRLPGGVDSPQTLWRLLKSGQNAIVPAPSDRWGLDAPLDGLRDAAGQPGKMQGGFLQRVDLFDPLFFGISPREAETMDPQQRLLLEVAWEAFENAGLSASEIQGTRTGVFIGIAGNDFAQRVLDQDQRHLDGYLATGSSHAVAAGRLAYTLNLTGPCLSIDTACSSSLVAVSTACDSLRSGRSDVALAGGVSLILSPETTLVLAQGGMLSPDFRCKTFDAAADGFVRGEGCGLVVLKRLDDARRDGDRILAVIRGTAVNQDGRSSGLTAPNGPAQQSLLREALADAGLSPSQVQYVEAHGTGTPLGDPIEVQALGAVYGVGRPTDQPLLVSSIKTNMGHLEAAAGIAGLMKLALSIELGEIPPLLHLQAPNPHVDWASLPLALPTKATAWPGERSTRAGGVSSFGFSGTNAHLLLAAADEPAVPNGVVDRTHHLLCLSGKSEQAVRTLAERYGDYFAEHGDDTLADVCYTANRGRTHHEHRLSIVAANNEEMRERLSSFGGSAPHASIRSGKLERAQSSDVVFLFTGQGSQYARMASDLYRTQPTFRAALDRCDDVLRGVWDQRLMDVLFSDAAEKAGSIDQTAYTQPALFAIEFALAELVQSWGIRPAAVLGHSVGEYVAACVAGVFSLEDGLKLIATRARLMQSLPAGGGMMAVLAAENDVVRAIAPFSKTLSIAAFNGPTNVVVSGPLADLDQFVRRLESQGLASQRLAVSHAFHSALLEPILEPLERAAEQVAYAEPRTTVISNLTGAPATTAELRSASYWRSHARQPVRFAAGMQALRGLGYKTFLEIGPAPVLSGMARRIVTDPNCRWLPMLRRGRADWEQLLESLGELYTTGVEIDWATFDRDYSRRKLPLPTYPFDRTRYWPELEPRTAEPSSIPGGSPTEAYRDWLYELDWQPLADSVLDAAPPSYLPSAGELQASASTAAADLYRQLEPADDEAAYRQIDSLCRDYIVEALMSLGCAFRAGERFATQELHSRLGILERHRRLFERMLSILAEDKVLERNGDSWMVTQTPAFGTAAMNLAALIKEHPQYATELAVLAPCGSNLADALVGRCDPMQLLFPGGSLDLTAKLYYETRPAALFNTVAEHCIADVIRTLPPDRSLRVLEIGAGTGGTTARVLPHLPADRSSYLFTDVSPQFLNRARELFSDYPSVDYQYFDAEHPIAEQGLKAEHFDVIIAANVLHATRDLRVTLDRVKELLKPEGLLVLLEVVRPQRLGDLTVGLTDGWWSFTDTDVRPDYALISEGGWLKLLSSAGFAEPVAVPHAAADKTGLFANQSLFLAKRPQQAASGQMSDSEPAGSWLLWCDEQGAGRRLAALLRGRGQKCLIVSRGDQFESLGNDEFRIQPQNPADHAKIVEAFLSANAADCRGAVYLWSLDASINESSDLGDVQTAVEHACQGALVAAQALVRASVHPNVTLTFVTRGAQSLGTSGENLQPAQSALWGLANVVTSEHPEFHCRRIDLDGRDNVDNSLALADELLRSNEDADQIALRNGSRRALQLKRAAARDLCYPAYRLRPNASYLVTGGLTGLGLETARWLVERGAKYLLLVGRRTPAEDAQVLIAAWAQSGVQVVSVQADIGEPADADRVFDAVNELRVPLRGVIHSAGTLDDASLLQQDWPHFARVLKAKADGAWNLHRRTQSAKLDFFVLYSSGASLLGSPGQANHAAANAFLDGLAHYRKAQGLPGLSINWGAWRGTGAAERSDVLDRIERSGVSSIDIKNGLKALECLLATGASQAAVLPIDWSNFSGRGRLFAGMDAERDKTAVPVVNRLVASRQWRENWKAAVPNRQRALIQDLASEEASRILGLAPTQTIDPRQPLQELGLDSLMAVQFRNHLSSWTGMELPATLLYSFPTLEQLVDHLTVSLTPDRQPDFSQSDEFIQPSEMDLDALSEDELARMLEQQIKLA